MLSALAGVTLAAALVLAVQTAVGQRRLPRLEDVAVPRRDPGAAGEGGEGGEAGEAGEGLPRVSVVVAARDEAAHIAATVGALLGQDYPWLEVVAIDDRSSDGTGPLLDRLAAAEASGRGRLRVLHVSELPAGWLGKNHALHIGAGAALGDLLLFTDADVVMRPDAVTRAVALLEREGLDHLAVAPRLRPGTAWTKAVVTVFLVTFLGVFRPWKAREPGGRHHIGVGAFNLLRASAYRSIGGHRRIALRPDDDLRLGRLVKEAGLRQAAAVGARHIEVEWYATLGAMARGLRKNVYAVANYRLGWLLLATLLPVLFIFWPVLALVVTSGATWWLNAGIVTLGLVSAADAARAYRLPLWTAAVYPAASAVFLWIVWAAALRAAVRGSIEWRGTEYPIDTLRGG